MFLYYLYRSPKFTYTVFYVFKQLLKNHSRSQPELQKLRIGSLTELELTGVTPVDVFKGTPQTQCLYV